MYINDLGYERVNAAGSRSNTAGTANTTAAKRSGSYATVMKQAVDNTKTVTTPTFASAGDIIIKEAFDKMKTDPEWETSVMDKVKEYYAGNSAVGSAESSYLNWMGSNSMQNYMLQSLAYGQGSLGMGLMGYSPYGFGNLAASAYSSMMGSALGSSLFGDWQL